MMSELRLRSGKRREHTATCSLGWAAAAMALAVALLVVAGAQSAQAAFFGQNGNIVYHRDGDIRMVDSTRSPSSPTLTANLTPNTPSWQDVDPAMSPSGRKVAFTSDRDGDFEIYTVDIYTGTLTKVTRNFVRDAQPAWSPDGARIAYESPNVAGDVDIFSKNADGTGSAVAEVSLSDNQYTPSWSPDGNRIAFYDGLTNDVWTYDSFFGTFGRTTANGTASQDLLPNWSPDGSRIVFQSNRPAPTDGSTDYEIYTARPSDGGGLRQLTDNAYDDSNAAYSPDGTRIVHNSYLFGDADLITRNSSDGSNAMELSDATTDDAAPDWGRVARPAAPGCSISGTFAADSMTGTDVANTICALGGNDRVDGYNGSDTLKGGTGSDRLVGEAGRDTHLGGSGNDTLDSRDGENGNDTLNGGSGTDRCMKDAREASVRSCP